MPSYYGGNTHTDSSSAAYTPSGSESISGAAAELSSPASPITRVGLHRTSSGEARRAPTKRRTSPKRGRPQRRKPPETRPPKRLRKRSRSNSADTDFAKRSKKLSREIREEAAGGQKFAEFTSEAYLQCARLFVDSGYNSLGSIRQMQETSRQYFPTDLRKGNKTRKPLRELRLVIDLLGLFVIQKDEEEPKYAEITIPGKLKYWPRSITNIRGLILPGQDACNHCSFERAKGRCKTHPIAPFALAEFRKKPWMAAESSHTRALGLWETMNKNHKRHSELELGFQAWAAYNLRFILAGGLASAWEIFGEIAMRPTHLGTVLNFPITENAPIAMTYDAKVRACANELSKLRTREKEITNLLKEEDRRIKREVRRECGPTKTFEPRNADLKRKNKDKWEGHDKGHQGKGHKGKGKHKFRGGNNWRQNSDWSQNNDWGNRPSHDWNDKPPNSNADGGQTSSPAANQENQTTAKHSKNKQKKQQCLGKGKRNSFTFVLKDRSPSLTQKAVTFEPPPYHPCGIRRGTSFPTFESPKSYIRTPSLQPPM